jgi:hypothetical protein
MESSLYFIAVFVFFIAFATIAFQLSTRKYHGGSREQFICGFADTTVPAEIPAAVYDYYNKKVVFSRFGVVSDRSYEYVLGVARDGSYGYVLRECEEDINEDTQSLMKDLGLTPPPEDVLLEWPTRIQTLREMVLWLDWIRQHEQLANSRHQCSNDHP